MKTILINVFDHAVAKNIFTPGFLRVVQAEKSTRLMVVVPEKKFSEFTNELSAPTVVVIGRPQKFASWFETLALFVARNSIPTHTVRQIQEEGLDGSGRLPPHKYFLARACWILSHLYLFRWLLKKILPLFFDTGVFDPILAAHRPDLVFATSMYSVDDLRLLRAARRHGIKTLGMVKSWDNLTSKENIIVPPDSLIVQNNVVKEEAVSLAHYPRKHISVVGVAQFDWYADPSFCITREEFFEKLQLDPTKKLITYAAMGLWLVPHEREIIALLAKIIQEEKLSHPAQLLVRLHPAYPDSKAELANIPGIVVDEPGSPVFSQNNFWKADWKFSVDDVRRLASTLRWSDVTLNCGSTMILDAVCFSTPIIGIAFDGIAHEPSYWRSARRLFEREHCKKVVETGGVRLVHSEQELIAALNRYLANSKEDSEGRTRIVKQQTGTLDGKAGERLAQAMLKTVGI